MMYSLEIGEPGFRETTVYIPRITDLYIRYLNNYRTGFISLGVVIEDHVVIGVL